MAIPKKARTSTRKKATPKVEPAAEPAVVAEPDAEPVDTNPIPEAHRAAEPDDGLAAGMELVDAANPGRRMRITAIRAGMVSFIGTGSVDVPASTLPRFVLAAYLDNGSWLVAE